MKRQFPISIIIPYRQWFCDPFLWSVLIDYMFIDPVIFYEAFLHIHHSNFIHQDNICKTLLSPFYKCRTRSPEKLGVLPTDTKLVSGRAGLKDRCSDSKSALFIKMQAKGILLLKIFLLAFLLLFLILLISSKRY